jgi:outer membrane immunogenic protein
LSSPGIRNSKISWRNKLQAPSKIAVSRQALPAANRFPPGLSSATVEDQARGLPHSRAIRGAALKKILLAGLALTLATPAVAQTPLPFNWTGSYVGVNFGGSWGRLSTDVALGGVPIGAGSFDMNGWVAGVQGGHNWQRGIWVYGLELDAQLTGQRGTAIAGSRTPDIPAIPAIPCVPIDIENPDCIPGTGIPGVPGVPGVAGIASYEQKLTWFATLRPRVGAAIMPTLLLYVTGGLVIGEVKTNAAFAVPGTTAFASFSNTRAGWTLGFGTEARLWPNWTVRIEYLYLDLGDTTNSFSSVAPFTGLIVAHSHLTDNIVRAALNYQFGGAPGN